MHPDRTATTLAHRDRLLENATSPLEDGSTADDPWPLGDARIPLQQLWHRASRIVAERGNAAARALLARVDSRDLRAGTVQDGVARGVAVALEEAISLCPAQDIEGAPPDDTSGTASHVRQLSQEPRLDVTEVVEGRDLRRRRELLVASNGARLRWSRRGGVLFVDRAHDVNQADCLRFEDRRDLGTLDGFVGDPDERPRLFSPAFLKPTRFETGPERTRLVLAGRLGRRRDGYPCELTVEGRATEDRLRLSIAIRNDHPDHRLRLRVLGCRNPAVLELDVDGAPAVVDTASGRAFLATTLVRSCGGLVVGGAHVDVPEGQCKGWIKRELRMGGAPWADLSKE